jgi:hypothetical protein
VSTVLIPYEDWLISIEHVQILPKR